MEKLLNCLKNSGAIWATLTTDQKYAFVRTFLAKFFALDPAAQKEFEEKNVNIEDHVKKLVDTFDFAFNPTTQPGALVGALMGIGKVHPGITPVRYYFLIAAILVTLREFMADGWTGDAQEDMFVVLEFVAATMQKGAAEAKQ